MKKFIGILMAFAIAFCNLSLLSVDAKIIEPKLIKTEKWTASYFIDNNIDNLYPYLACEADIYNDGEVKVYVWNTHEWTDFNIIKHQVKINELTPYPDYEEGLRGIEATQRIIDDNIFEIGSENYNVNIYPQQYDLKETPEDNFRLYDFRFIGYCGRYDGTLPEMQFSTERPEVCMCWHFVPTRAVKATETYTFHLFSHDIVITPELFQTTEYPIVETFSQETELIKKYKNEIADLKVKNTTYVAQLAEYEATIDMYETLLTAVSLERGDVNNDGFINAVDASQILAYYAYTSTGGHLDFMDFLEGKADKEES